MRVKRPHPELERRLRTAEAEHADAVSRLDLAEQALRTARHDLHNVEDRDRALERRVDDLAFELIKGGTPAVPDELAATMEKRVPELRRALEQRQRDERASLSRFYLRLDEWAYQPDGARRGFADPADFED